MDIHSISSSHNSGMAFTNTIDSHTIITDTASYDGGNTGPSPKKLMLVALAGCTGIDIADILSKMRVNFSNLKIDIKGILTDTDPKTYKEISILYSIKIANEDQPKMVKAVNLSLEKYCGVSAMFKSFAEIKHEIIYA